MNKTGTVAVWLGTAESDEDFWTALEVSFSEDGDFMGSRFSRAANISYYEDATREADRVEEGPSTLAELLEGVSYDDVVLPQMQDRGVVLRGGENCFIMLYDVSLDDETALGATLDLNGVNLRFVGEFSYR